MNRGYVKIYRKIEDCSLWADDEPYCKRAAWIDLIAMANHEDNSFIIGMSKKQVKRGQRWTSLEKLATRWKWSVKKVDRFLNLLQSEGMIYREATNKGTVITIVNYGIYQDAKSKSDKRTTEQSTKQTTYDGKTNDQATDQATDRQTIMTKNDIKNDIKNDKRMNKKPAAHSHSFVGKVVYEE